jgi:hypothetical protein
MGITNGTYTWDAWNPASYNAAASSASVGDGSGIVLRSDGMTFGGIAALVYETGNVLNFTVAVNGIQYWGLLFALPIVNWLVGALYIGSGQNSLCSMAAISPVSAQAPNGSFNVQFVNTPILNGTLAVQPNIQNPSSPNLTYTLSSGVGTVTATATWTRPTITITLTVSGNPTLNGTYVLNGFFSPAMGQPGYRGTTPGVIGTADQWAATDSGSSAP